MASVASTGIPVDTTDNVNVIVLPIFATLAILVTYLPFCSFYQNRNFAACNIVVVAVLQNFFTITNAIIWNDGNWASWWLGYGFCDLQVYIKIPITTAIATSVACLTMNLANAIDVDRHTFNQSAAKKRRDLIRDVAICWTIPVLQIALYYVVQVYVLSPHSHGIGNFPCLM